MFVLDELAQLREYYHRAGFSTGYWQRLTDALSVWLTNRGNTPALLEDLTLTVDSATGDDSADGSSTAPFATLQRALDERAKYGELNAALVIELKGVGPYAMTELAGSVCGTNGRFEIRGDDDVRTIATTGTFTGAFSGVTANVAAGLGVDTYAGQFLRITSGALAGYEFTLTQHTDTSVTVASNYGWPGNVANGDTYEIFTPGTEIALPPYENLYDRKSGFHNLQGGAPGQLNLPYHWLRLVKLTCTSGLSIVFGNAQLGLSAVQITASSVMDAAQVVCGCVDDAEEFGLPSVSGSDGRLFGAGVLFAGTNLYSTTYCRGIIACTSSLNVRDVSGLMFMGGRTFASFALSGSAFCYFYFSGYTAASIVLDRLVANDNTTFQMVASMSINSATANTTLLTLMGAAAGYIYGTVTGAATGTGYGISLATGTRLVTRLQPALLGVAGADIKLPNLAAQPVTALATTATAIIDTTTGTAFART